MYVCMAICIKYYIMEAEQYVMIITWRKCYNERIYYNRNLIKCNTRWPKEMVTPLLWLLWWIFFYNSLIQGDPKRIYCHTACRRKKLNRTRAFFLDHSVLWGLREKDVFLENRTDVSKCFFFQYL